jgi:site-specific recombinase XerD
MTSIKLKFRPSANGNGGSLYYQIIHQRVVRQIGTDYHIPQSAWNEKSGCVIGAENSLIRQHIRFDLARIRRIISRLENEIGEYSADDIVERYHAELHENTLFNFMQQVIDRERQLGKERTAETYLAALISFRKFREGKDVMLDEIDGEMMENYQAWMKSNGLAANTISFYMRRMRATINRAVRKNIISDKRLFQNVFTSNDKTVKRALPANIIRQIREADLSAQPKLEFARDMFMLSFYLRGIAFVDMAYLRKTDLQNGVLTYHRRKTGQRITIKWTKKMQDILDKYSNNATQYLLPIITTEGNTRKAYLNAAHRINTQLKKLGEALNISTPLTFYRARHCWATVARSEGIALSVISEGLGHNNERTTEIYLASLDTTVLDAANDRIIDAV